MPILAGQMDLFTQLNYDPSQIFQTLQSSAQAARGAPSNFAFERSYLQFMHFLAKQGQARPDFYLEALRIWGSFNSFYNDEELAVLAARNIEGYFQRAGRNDLARGFQQLDPVDELWVRRYWVPPELHSWRDRKGAGLSKPKRLALGPRSAKINESALDWRTICRRKGARQRGNGRCPAHP
jgi:hypothetical protein